MNRIDEEILELINQTGISFELREHGAVYTSPQMAKYLGTDEGRIAKSMVLKTSKGAYALVVLPGKFKIDFTRLAKLIGDDKVSLAPASEAERMAKCSVGAVHPFGNLVNLRTYFDSQLLNVDYVFFNPGVHTKSIKINTHDLMRLVKPTILEFARPR